jgi:hypothetical protein
MVDGVDDQSGTVYKRGAAAILSVLFNIKTLQYILLLIGVLILVGIGYGLFSTGNFIGRLSVTENARGLITFLVAVTTVAVAILSILYIISSNEGNDIVKERFGFIKEIFTSLIAILGTVLGFYFGSSDKSAGQQIQLADAKFVGASIMTTISGGSPPYRYKLTYKGSTASTDVSEDGWIVKTLSPLPSPKEEISIDITDAKELHVTKTVNFDGGSTAKPSEPKVPVPGTSTKADTAGVQGSAAPVAPVASTASR